MLQVDHVAVYWFTRLEDHRALTWAGNTTSRSTTGPEGLPTGSCSSEPQPQPAGAFLVPGPSHVGAAPPPSAAGCRWTGQGLALSSSVRRATAVTWRCRSGGRSATSSRTTMRAPTASGQGPGTRHFSRPWTRVVTRLADAHTAGRLHDELARLGRYPLLVVDEVATSPSSPPPRPVPPDCEQPRQTGLTDRHQHTSSAEVNRAGVAGRQGGQHGRPADAAGAPGLRRHGTDVSLR